MSRGAITLKKFGPLPRASRDDRIHDFPVARQQQDHHLPSLVIDIEGRIAALLGAETCVPSGEEICLIPRLSRFGTQAGRMLVQAGSPHEADSWGAGEAG
jgi:hypothetical protein